LGGRGNLPGSGFALALLISNAGESLKGRPCDQLSQEENLRNLLEIFQYDLRSFKDVEKEYNESNQIAWLRRNYRLVIVYLKELSEDYAAIMPVVWSSGVPCIFIGDRASMPTSNVMRFITKYYPTNIRNATSNRSSAGIPFFGCCGSFSAFLDMKRRLDWYNVSQAIRPEMEAYIHELVLTELSNFLDGRK
jgi:hypothetical protein